jgi:hypothetical protein
LSLFFTVNGFNMQISINYFLKNLKITSNCSFIRCSDIGVLGYFVDFEEKIN